MPDHVAEQEVEKSDLGSEPQTIEMLVDLGAKWADLGTEGRTMSCDLVTERRELEQMMDQEAK